MKEGFRQCTAWLHTWTGLVVGWVLFFIFVTGTAGYFQAEITRWMQPELPMSARAGVPTDPVLAVHHALDRLEQVAPGAARWSITLPHQSLVQRRWENLGVAWEDMPVSGNGAGQRGSETLDAATGAVLPAGPQPRDTAGGRVLYRMHYELRYMPYAWAIRIVGVCTMLMLLAITTGVITHKKIFTDFFTFRPGKGQRSWLDAHNAISVMALPFFLMITYSGLVFALFVYMPVGRDVLYGPDPLSKARFANELFERDGLAHAPVARPAIPLAPLMAQAEAAWGVGQLRSIAIERHEGGSPEITLTRVQRGSLDVWNPPALRFDAGTGALLPSAPPPGGSALQAQGALFNLHEGLFADIWGRWLYFVAGLLGCAMIGTGLVLWTVKRRRHHLGGGQERNEHMGVRLVEVLNVATIAGLPLAVAAYFWANRLLPLGMAERAAWEIHTLFALWLATLFYALARPLHRAWIELLWAACAAYALVPAVNALTTDKHLGRTLPAGDWVLAGFDLTMWGLAGLFALLALKVARRLRPVVAQASAPKTAVP
ncbi:PepSY-associated TM helix domain-containing protein [Hydrogenophaga sp. BPS33]|uniref:PepSY-associated TM helix domain-containing protein n=1 Tax=Hydrogenophaga sp. BPS33 TaxID=2651974 RepID=UPI00131F63F4|nr:PepSY-associated TM helix domain-containing protein [Hydrogenophaga sp. BPS33]QHE83639.1 PepSY domain-containing protein [Hydrogenophaga sp. BPS33]